MSETIKCRLRLHERFEGIFGQRGEKKKLGSYHGSYFWDVAGFGRDKWMLILTIEGVDIDKYLESGLSEEEVVEGCIGFLNTPVGKRKKKQLYGNLELYRPKNPSWTEGEYNPRFTIKESDDAKYIVAMVLTDQKKNKNFFGKGHSIFKIRRKKRK